MGEKTGERRRVRRTENEESRVTRARWEKCPLITHVLSPLQRAHLHRPAPHQTQPSLTELSDGPEAMSHFQIHIKNPSGEPALTLVTVLNSDDSLSESTNGCSQTSSSSQRLSWQQGNNLNLFTPRLTVCIFMGETCL